MRRLLAGSVKAEALWFSAGPGDDRAARQRILRSWMPGATLSAVPGGGWILTLPDRPQIDTRSACAAPLVRRAECWSAVGGTEREWSRLAPPPGAIVLLRGGAPLLLQREALEPVEPSAWLDLGSLQLLNLEPAPGEVAPVELPAPGTESVREALGAGVPERSVADEQLLGAMGALAGSPGKSRAEASPPSWWARVLGWFQTAAAAGRSGAGRPLERGTEGPPPSPARVVERLRRWMANLARWSGVSLLIGRRQAAYLRRMLDLFEQRDLHEALRHAIPLGGDGAARGTPSFGAPTPRKTLEITSGTSSGGTLGVGPELFRHLEVTYRQAVTRLERQGEFEQAAFVLAVLLRAEEEAVSFLERHGRLLEAARLAEARRLPPGLIVRQWFLAGQLERALEVARRHSAYADAITRLRSHPEAARRVRLLWAETLAQAGQYGQAAEVIWPDPEGRNLADAWLARAIALGGITGAKAIARRLALRNAATDPELAPAAELLSDTSRERLPERLAFSTALTAELTAPERHGEQEGQRHLRALARRAVRTLVRDAGRFGSAQVQRTLRELTERLGDAALRTDLPPLPAVGSVPRRPLPERLVLSAADAGTQPLWDVAPLARGRLLVALGEAGIGLVAADGRLLRHLDIPAEHLVISDTGAYAIALVARGEVWRVSRIDLVQWRGGHWMDARLDGWADTFDGAKWFVSEGHRILAVDALSSRFRALWHIPDLEGHVVAMSRPEARFTFVTGGATPELWSIETSDFTLRERRALPPPEGGLRLAPRKNHLWVDAAGRPFEIVLQVSETHVVLTLTLPAGQPLPLPDEPVSSTGETEIRRVAVSGAHLALQTRRTHPVIQLLNTRALAERSFPQDVSEVVFEGATRVAMRPAAEGSFVVADDLGRILVLDAESGGTRRLNVTQ